jgi:hypothetical protein
MSNLVNLKKSDEAQPLDEKAARARMLERIKEIKSDPSRYQDLRERLKSKTNDEDRAEVLVDFITNNDDLLTTLAPDEDKRVEAFWSITLTTVFIFASPAY